MTETPDWLNPVPFGDPGHGQLPGIPQQREVLSEEQMRQIRRQLLESILSSVVQAVRGLFVPGPFGAALKQLEEWAKDLPLLSAIVEAITGSPGGLDHLRDWFITNIKEAIDKIRADAVIYNALVKLISDSLSRLEILLRNKLLAGSNLVANPSFSDIEFPLTPYGNPTSYGYSTERRHSGLTSYKWVQAGASHDGLWWPFNLKADTKLAVSEKDKYYVQAWVLPHTANSGTGSAYFGAYLEDSTGTNQPVYVDVKSALGVSQGWSWSSKPKGLWSLVRGYITIPDGYDSMQVYIQAASDVPANDAFYLDDLVCREVTDARLAFSLAEWAENLANTAKANADIAIANFTSILNKWGFTNIADWINDIWATKGIANTAKVNADTAIANFSAILNKWGMSNLADWINDVWATKGITNASATSGVNLIPDPSFDDGALDQIRRDFNTLSGNYEYDSTKQHSGNRSIKCTYEGGQAYPGIFLTPTLDPGRKIHVVPGQVFYLSQWVSASPSNTGSGLVEAYLELSDSKGVNPNTWITGPTSVVANNGAWVKQEGHAIVPAGYDRMYLYMAAVRPGNNAGDVFWFDDMVAVDVTDAYNAKTIAEAARANADKAMDNFAAILSKWGFTKLADWIDDIFAVKGTANTANANANNANALATLARLFATWKLKANSNLVLDPSCSETSAWGIAAQGSLTVSNEQFRSGPTSLKYVHTSPANYPSISFVQDGSTTPIKLDCQPGDIFYAEVWARIKAGNSGTNPVFIQFLAHDSTGVGADYVTGTWQNTANVLPTTTSWSKISGFFTVPAGRDQLTISISGGITGAANDTYYFDDLIVREVTDSKKAFDLATTVQGIANTAKANADQALSNFTSILTKWGFSNLSDWINDVWATKGTANTANTNATTALANFTTALNKFGFTTVAQWVDDLFGTKGTASAAGSTANTAKANADQALANFTTALTKFGAGTVADWVNDLFNTRGVASSASTAAGVADGKGTTALNNFNAILTKFSLPTLDSWLDNLLGTRNTANAAGSTASSAKANADQALANFQTALTKFGFGNVADWVNDLFSTKGTASTAGTNATNAVNTANAANTTAGTANTNANTALGNWQTALNKWGLGSVASWVDDVWGTRGTASAASAAASTAQSTANTANTTAGTAKTNADQALANFQAAFTKFGSGGIAAWVDSLFATKGTADTANTTANAANSAASTAGSTANTARDNLQTTWNNLWNAFKGTTGATGITAAQVQTAGGEVRTTATTANATANTAQSTANTANSTATTANTNLQTNIDNIFGSLTGTEDVVGSTLAQQLQALKDTYQKLLENSRKIDELSAKKGQESTKGSLISMNFGDYPNGALPAILTTTYTGSGSSTIGISGGSAQWINTNNADRTAKVIHNTSTQTDFQVLKGTMSTPPQVAKGGGIPKFCAIGRVSDDGNSYVWARGYQQSALTFKGEIGYTLNGVETVWASNISLSWNLSMTVYLGVGTNARQYQIYSGDKLVYTHTEVGTSSQLGVNNRRFGVITDIKAGTNNPVIGGKLEGFSVYDNETPSVNGSTARMYRNTTGGSFAGGNVATALPNGFWTNPNYESPDVDANTVDGTMTVTEAKSYAISARLDIANALTAPGVMDIILQVFRGGSWQNAQFGQSHNVGAAGTSLFGSWVQYLNAGEKVRIATQRGGIATTSLGGDAAGTLTYFSIAGLG